MHAHEEYSDGFPAPDPTPEMDWFAMAASTARAQGAAWLPRITPPTRAEIEAMDREYEAIPDLGEVHGAYEEATVRAIRQAGSRRDPVPDRIAPPSITMPQETLVRLVRELDAVTRCLRDVEPCVLRGDLQTACALHRETLQRVRRELVSRCVVQSAVAPAIGTDAVRAAA